MKRYLLAPGPTPIPPEVMAAMSAPIIHHRTPRFSTLLAQVEHDLQDLFQTNQDVVILAASGTGGMEAVVTNLLSPGDEAIVVNAGKFGDRWANICAAYGIVTHEIAVEWGEPVETPAVLGALDGDPAARVLLMQATETSTTVLHPVVKIAALMRERDTLFVVDGITAVGVVDIAMDRW